LSLKLHLPVKISGPHSVSKHTCAHTQTRLLVQALSLCLTPSVCLSFSQQQTKKEIPVCFHGMFWVE